MFFKHVITITKLDLITSDCDIELKTHHLDYPDDVKTTIISTKIDSDKFKEYTEEQKIEWLRENDSQLFIAQKEHEAQLINTIDNPFELKNPPWEKLSSSNLQKTQSRITI